MGVRKDPFTQTRHLCPLRIHTELGFRQGVGTLAGFQDDRTEAQGVDGGGGGGCGGEGWIWAQFPFPSPHPICSRDRQCSVGW